MNSLETLRRRRLWWLVWFGLGLAAMVFWNVARPSPEARQAADFSQNLMTRDARTLSETERQELRRQWERFSPETRQQIFFKIARSNLEKFREETARLTAAERAARVQEEIGRMRERQSRLTETERGQIRDRLKDKEAAEMVKKFMEFFSTELTAKERAELDPLIKEWFRTVEGRY
jgi:hypothetical protein